jgi:hypothetical protein
MPRISVARPAIVVVAITMEDKMRGSLIALAAAAALSTSIISQAAEENLADFVQFHEVEIIFHQAASTKNLDLMMALFADDATSVRRWKDLRRKSSSQELLRDGCRAISTTKPVGGLHASPTYSL